VLVALLATACLPFGGLQTDRVARSENTVTEYFEGAYRVTRCDAHGRAERTTTMARILTPTAVAPFVVIEEQTARTRVARLYLGARRASIHTKPDGSSMVDRGGLGLCGSQVTLACAWTFTDAGGRIVETDQRYGSRWRWSTRGRAGHYDVESAAAHETGHSIGLGHTTTSRYLTMHHQLCAGCTFARSLGRGDIRGLRKLY